MTNGTAKKRTAKKAASRKPAAPRVIQPRLTEKQREELLAEGEALLAKDKEQTARVEQWIEDATGKREKKAE